MKKWSKVGLGVLLIVLIGLVGWQALGPRPSHSLYEGMPLDYWLNTFQSGPAAFPAARLGSNALPVLRQALERQDGSLQTIYEGVWRGSPDVLRRRMPKRVAATLIRGNACFVLRELGDEAAPAVPQLLRLLKEDSDSSVRLMVAQCLQRVGVHDDMATLALVAALGDKEPAVRAMAAKSLGARGHTSEPVVAALVTSLRDDSQKVREAAGAAMLQISPDAAAKAGLH